jgi:hypothetical protein
MVFGNRVLRNIFGPKREEGAASWRFYSSLNVIRVIKSRK